MTDDERTMNHFAATAPPCPHRQKPALVWDGCWAITCGPACKCQNSDGDHTSPTPILTQWHERRRQ